MAACLGAKFPEQSVRVVWQHPNAWDYRSCWLHRMITNKVAKQINERSEVLEPVVWEHNACHASLNCCSQGTPTVLVGCGVPHHLVPRLGGPPVCQHNDI